MRQNSIRWKTMECVFTPAEQSELVLAAYKLVENQNVDAYIKHLNRITVDKIYKNQEVMRLANLNLPHA